MKHPGEGLRLGMFEIVVESEFSAAHALTIAGQREMLHGHDWRVTLTLEGERLDPDGLLCDFHTVQNTLRELTDRFHNRNLNDTAPFDRVNPSAEQVAKFIGDRMVSFVSEFAPHARVAMVTVTEAPRCKAAYRPQVEAR